MTLLLKGIEKEEQTKKPKPVFNRFGLFCLSAVQRVRVVEADCSQLSSGCTYVISLIAAGAPRAIQRGRA
ncbi:MAG TPA: hypothetical protein VF555_12730 [Variovorax sp.]